jgi:hypothetical protein
VHFFFEKEGDEDLQSNMRHWQEIPCSSEVVAIEDRGMVKAPADDAV